MKKNIILQGEALETLKNLPDNSVDCIVTSPPYWMLRDYGVDDQLGREIHFDDYINKLCNIFDEVKRVLKPGGTCFVNLGDSYVKNNIHVDDITIAKKSLYLIPFRFAIEMINRGWLLRNNIIWHKPNAMPSNAKDRFTIDFEYIFFFTKSENYYFNQQFEPMDEKEVKYRYELRANKIYQLKGPYKNVPIPNPFAKGRNKRSVWSVNTKPYSGAHIAPYPEELIRTPILAGCPEDGIVLDPFLGSGTTAKVAKELGRKYIGIELNPAYVALAENRIH